MSPPISSGTDYNALTALFEHEIGDESRLIEERIQAMRDLYLQAVKEQMLLQRRKERYASLRNELQQQHTILAEELNKQQAELSKAAVQRDRLQALAGELQKQKHGLVNTAKQTEQENESRRQEISTQFLDTIKTIGARLDEHGEQRMQHLRENETLKTELRRSLEKYSKREEEFKALFHAKQQRVRELEDQQREQEALFAAEQQRTEGYQEHIRSLAASEAELRGQLSMYAEKFEQFQEALNSSNDMFNSFKRKMEEMTRTIKKLEKENAEMQDRAQKSRDTVSEMRRECEFLRSKYEGTVKRNEKLESLCNALREDNHKSRENIRIMSREQLRALQDVELVPAAAASSAPQEMALALESVRLHGTPANGEAPIDTGRTEHKAPPEAETKRINGKPKSPQTHSGVKKAGGGKARNRSPS
jgi:chromosome segregation ATPase